MVPCPPTMLVGQPICPKLKFSTPLAGHLYYHNASEYYSWEPDACVLRRLTGEEARACLADVGPIAFLGDSVSRYQFLTLSHFMASGKYQFPYDGKQSLSNAHTHSGRSGDGLNDFDRLWRHARHQVMSHGGSNAEFAYMHNRSAGLDTARVRLSSTGAGNAGASAGTSGSSGEAIMRRDVRNSGVLRTGSGQGSEEAPSQGAPVAELLYNFISKGDPSTVEAALDWVSRQTDRPPLLVLNACAHYHDTADWEYSKPVIQTLRWWSKRRQRMGKQAGALIWRSCTTPTKAILQQVDEEEAKISHAAKKAGVPVFDVREVAAASWRQHVAATLAPTSVHFYRFLYESFNDVLLNILCPSGE